jgi:hypothetical protein
VDCDANPIYTNNGSNGPCCRYECPSDAPDGWPQFASLEACEGSCPPGFVSCDGDASNGCEVDIQNSLFHCGACNNVCNDVPNAAPVCIAGACAIQSCDAGWSDCNGDTSDGCEVYWPSDPSNCGSCGAECALPHASSTCDFSSCIIDACDSGFGDCDGLSANGCETNFSESPENCGGCDVVCPNPNGTTATCTNGVCGAICNQGYANCDAVVANGCETNLNVDANNCGACGVVCPIPGTFCINGTCPID